MKQRFGSTGPRSGFSKRGRHSTSGSTAQRAVSAFTGLVIASAGLLSTMVLAAPAANAATPPGPTCQGVLTKITYDYGVNGQTDPSRATNGYKLSPEAVTSWTSEPTPWSWVNAGRSGPLDVVHFDVQVPDGAKAGDTYTVNTYGAVYVRSQPQPLKTADGTVIATTTQTDRGWTFTFTDAVNTLTGVTATYSSTVGFRTSDFPDNAVDGSRMPSGVVGCEDGVTAGYDVIGTPIQNNTGLSTSWSSGQDAPVVQLRYEGVPVEDLNPVTLTISIDRPGAAFATDRLQNQVSPWGVGEGVWSADQKMIEDGILGKLVTGTPQNGNEYRIVSSDGRNVVIEWKPAKVGDGIHFQQLTGSDGTTGWSALGDRPFNFTVTETQNGAKVFNGTQAPPRPTSSSGATGTTRETEPMLSKTWDAQRGAFVLKITNPSNDAVVPAGTYTDTMNDPFSVSLSEPTVGTVKDNVWTVPVMAPGESATALAVFDAKSVPGGTTAKNTFCLTGSTKLCATAEVSGEFGSAKWTKTDPAGKLLMGSEWILKAPDKSVIIVVDNGLNDIDPADGKLAVAKLKWGTYELTETKAPVGYGAGTKPLVFTVNAKTLNVDLDEILNSPATGVATWRKVDSADQTVLAGSEWELTRPDKTVTKVVDNGEGDTDPAVGSLKPVGLTWGAYSLVETKAPTGYDLDSTPHEFSISATELAIQLGDVKNTKTPVASSAPTPTPSAADDVPSVGEALAFTGSPLVPVLGGLALLGIGAGAVFLFLARRKRATPLTASRSK